MTKFGRPLLFYSAFLKKKHVYLKIFYTFIPKYREVSEGRKHIATELLVISVVALLAVLAEWSIGSLPLELFRAPLNILLLALWVIATLWLYRHRATSAIARSLLSTRATWLSLALLVILGILFGLATTPATTSWPAAAAILFILTHLLLVTLRGARRSDGGWRVSFMLNHLGLLLALGSGFWGAADRVELRAIVGHDAAATEVYSESGGRTLLDYELSLQEFRIDYFVGGTPAAFEADVVIDGEATTLRVNHPYNRTLSETIYLLGYDVEQPEAARYCILEVVREPWRWLTFSGIVMLIAGAVFMFIQGRR